MMKQYNKETDFKDKIYLLAVQSLAQIFNKTVMKKLDFEIQTAIKEERFLKTF